MKSSTTWSGKVDMARVENNQCKYLKELMESEFKFLFIITKFPLLADC